MRSVATLIAIALASNALAYEPPIGIPDPADSWTGFGEIDQATPAWPASWLTGTTSESAGYYFIDKTDPSATNSGNTYGHPDLPRLTPPEGNVTGARMIYFHAGTYTSTDSAGDRFDWSGTFTAAEPLWITGNAETHPILTDDVQIGAVASTSWLVFEKIDLIGAVPYIQVCPVTDGHTIDHVLIRHVVRTGTQTIGDNGGVLAGRSASTDTIPTSTVTDVVGYNLTMSAIGDKATEDTPGWYAGYHTQRIWILDSVFHDIAADAIAGSHYSDASGKRTQDYYAGRNTAYACGENALDWKAVERGVISQNHFYGPMARGSGTLVVLHYGATPSTACTNVAVIFNRIHFGGGGIGNGGSFGANNVIIAGNLIYDIHASHAVSPDPLFGNCVQIGGSNGSMYIVDNTFYDYDEGIAIEDLDGSDSVKIHGNLFGSVHTDAARFELKTVNGQQGLITLNYNLYPAGATFLWANASRNLAYMQGTALQEVNAVTGAPLLDDPTTGDFTLEAGSAAIGVSVEGPTGDSVYDVFATRYGVSIEKDFSGAARPQDGTWDIGAFEFDAGGGVSTGGVLRGKPLLRGKAKFQ